MINTVMKEIDEINKLRNKIEALKEENTQLKSGIQEVFNTVPDLYRIDYQPNSPQDILNILGTTFKNVESKKNILNQNLQTLDSVSDGIAIFNKEGILVFSNKSFPKVFRLKSVDLLDKHWREIFTGLTKNPIKALISEANANYAIHKEVVIPYKGKNIFIATSMYPLSNGSFLTNAKDVTTEKEKLHKIQEQALLLKSSGEFIGICNSDFEFTFLNDAAIHLFSIQNDWAGVKFDDFILEKKSFTDEVIPKLKERKGWIGELNATTRNRTFPVGCEILPFEASQVSNGGYYIILRDITERKQAIKKLVDAKDVAENNMKIRQQFLANMSHEVRTPMNAIIGLSNLLLDGKLVGKQKEFANSIKLSADNLLVIINDILDISKIESGKLTIESVSFNFYKLIEGVKSIFKHKIEEKDIKFIIDIQEEIPEFLVGDPTRLNQILLNLIGNAVKFTDKGHIALTVKISEKKLKETTLQFQVEDTGKGIAKENLKKIFNVFTQESNNTTRLYGGTGLGLAIVKQLISIQGGKITVDSIINKGSTFSAEIKYKIPNKNKNKKVEFNSNFELSKLKESKIIMAEDYPMNQLLAKSLFDKWGINLTIVENGKILLNDLNTNSYDIILMDIQMPEMDGLEATRKLRQRGIKTPVIAITAHAFKEEQEQCIKAGMNDFISKPFKEDELKEKLITFLNIKTTDIQYISNKISTPISIDISYFKLDYIKEMGAGNEQFVTEMLEMFLEQVPQLLNNIIKAVNTGNKVDVSKYAHTLQSSFVIIERADVQSDLKKLELWGKNIESLDNPIGQLESIIEKAKLIIQSISDYLGLISNTSFTSIEMVYSTDAINALNINFNKLNELAEGNKDFVKEMLTLYISQTSKQLKDLKLLFEKNNYEGASVIFHNMIASFDLIGCENLMNSSRRLENSTLNHKQSKNLTNMANQFITLTESTFKIVKTKARSEFKINL